MHTLNDVATVVENSLYVFGIHGTREVRVAVMLSLSRGSADTLQSMRKPTIDFLKGNLPGTRHE